MMAMGGQPFNTAQAQAADSGFGYQPAPPSADLSGAQAPPAGGMDPNKPKFFQGSPTELGQLRDMIMSQFPGVNDIDDEPMDFNQQAALFAIALANPKGALDMIREKKDRQLKKRQMAAEFNMHAMTLASHVMDAQNQMSLGLATLNQNATHFKMENDVAEARTETERGRLRVEQSRADIAQSEARRHAASQDIAMSMMIQGTDAGGQEVSAPYGTPGFKSRAEAGGMVPSFDEHGMSLGQAKPTTDTSIALRRAALTEKAARARTGRQFVDPQFEGTLPGQLDDIISPTTDKITLLNRAGMNTGNSPESKANRTAPPMHPDDLEDVTGGGEAQWFQNND